MTITRVEEVTYGVADVAQCSQFLTDFGLFPVETTPAESVFRTATNQLVRLRDIEDPALPSAVAEGPCIRQIIWGVSDAADIDNIASRLDATTHGPDGVLITADLTGFSIGFRVARSEPAPVNRRRINSWGVTERVNDRHGRYERAHPLRIIHVALDIPKAGAAEATRFYIDRLNFKPVEDVAPTGTFLQCEGESDHHQLFLCHRTNRGGINHVAFEVNDFDEIAEGGNFMTQKGWEEVRRLGRHTVGSNVFRFFAAPMGGRVEYAADMDKVEKDVPTRFWPDSPPHHLWILKGE